MDSNYDNIESTNESVVLDNQTSDLNLIIDKECLLAYPMSEDGFCSLWAGCRANYGVESGRVAFEVNLEDYCECTDLPKDDTEPYSIRVGWSIAQSSLQLGENQYSFSFCNNGKKCHDKTFEDYGAVLDKGDSIAAYIDFETEPEKIQFSFSKNGTDMGIAFVISKNDFFKSCQNEFKNDEQKFLFFPHVLSKNIVFEMNFGQRVSLIGDEPFAPIKNDFLLIQKIPIEKRFCYVDQSNEIKPNTNPEVLILVGLPYAGKTNWALNYSKLNPKKYYFIIGISTILDQMKIANKKQKIAITESKQNIENIQTDVNGEISNTDSVNENATIQTSTTLTKYQTETLDKVLKCMNILFEIASQSNRNIIIDQPNVYESTRRRKMKLFENWQRRAIVIIPTDEVYIERMSIAEKSGREICTSLVDDMKANFTLPKQCDYIDSVEYTELNEEEARKLLEIYNKEGLISRHNGVVNRRLKTKQAIMKLHAGKLGSINAAASAAAAAMPRFGIRMNAPFYQPGVPYSPDPRFNRFSSPQMGNPRRGYSNQPYRSRYPNPFTRPQTFGVQQFGAPNPYGVVSQQWPAATSTELWTHQQQMAQYQSMPPSNSSQIWAPALPVSNNSAAMQAMQMMPNMISSWHPSIHDLSREKENNKK